MSSKPGKINTSFWENKIKNNKNDSKPKLRSAPKRNKFKTVWESRFAAQDKKIEPSYKPPKKIIKNPAQIIRNNASASNWRQLNQAPELLTRLQAKTGGSRVAALAASLNIHPQRMRNKLPSSVIRS